MHYDLITELIGLVKLYEKESLNNGQDVYIFGQWLNEHLQKNGARTLEEPDWKGKTKGRSADSVINTSLVHLFRYAKLQAKSAIIDTEFSTPDDFIYLITLMSFGSMSKTALIKMNVHEKSAGIQIINRLIKGGLVEQTGDSGDKRNKIIHITPKGTELLNQNMQNIRIATRNVTEPLTHQEKMDLIRLLSKLEDFHEAKALV